MSITVNVSSNTSDLVAKSDGVVAVNEGLALTSISQGFNFASNRTSKP
jgi:hypothetical protein